MARLPCMAEQDLDVQKWLENAADEHLRTKAHIPAS
jgi:hypothetical protein